MMGNPEKCRTVSCMLWAIPVWLAVFALVSPARALSADTSFQYEGLLTDGWAYANGAYDFVITIYGTSDAVSPLVAPIALEDVPVTNGRFTLALDFGMDFTSLWGWAEIQIRRGAETGAYTVLSPRQYLGPAPCAGNAPFVLYDGQIAQPRSVTLESGAFAVIAGGENNSADGDHAVVGGGKDNSSSGAFSMTAGGQTNVASGDFSTIGGGDNNVASGLESTVAGGRYNSATGEKSTVGGGRWNSATELDATVAGGRGNNAIWCDTFIGGGRFNTATASAASIVGGANNTATGLNSSIGGGESNLASGEYSTVGGGDLNISTASESTVAGGSKNRATEIRSFVGGGANNYSHADSSTISGGSWNNAFGVNSVIGGGFNNISCQPYSAVGGGHSNDANGPYSAIPGGRLNKALGWTSFAGGRQAKALNNGSFVWADNLGIDLISERNNQFLVRASGGVKFETNSAGTSGVELLPGSGTWTQFSDRNAKEHFTEVDKRQMLEKVAALPIQSWNYRSQDASIRHIGPMAQDWSQAFRVGGKPTGIDSVDADGVALAAIQGLYQVVQEKDAKIQALEQRIENLEKQTK
ncbi:MAG: tail fiber domain-containing protein [Candidatus Sumerlaeota bacterium]|nr:tail fiber domain-containing protein [Candidatus Sumerlaeota bacterium]